MKKKIEYLISIVISLIIRGHIALANDDDIHRS